MSADLERIGERVGPFQIVEWLRTTGGVAMYRGLRPETSRQPRQVALRMPARPGDPVTALRLRREYDILREMDDPRVPRAYGWYTGQAALAHSWIDGVTLEEVLQSWARRLVPHDPGTGLDIGIEVAHALRHAHSLVRDGDTIVFGNLAPDQVLLCPDGRVFLQGFGQEPGAHDKAYSAPERVAGAFQDVRTDQWDLGALLVEVLTGQKVGPDDALAQNIGPDNPLQRIGSRWPELGAVLQRMLAPAAGDRYANESELLRQLMSASRAVQGNPDRSRLAGQVGDVVQRLRHPHIADGPQEPAQPASLERSAEPPPHPVRPPASPPPRQTPSPAQPPTAQLSAVPSPLGTSPTLAPRDAAPAAPRTAVVEFSDDPDSASVPTPILVELSGDPDSILPDVAPPPDASAPRGISARSVQPQAEDWTAAPDPLHPIASPPRPHPVEVSYDPASTPGISPVEVDYDPDSKPLLASRAHSVAVHAPDQPVDPDDLTQPAVTLPIRPTDAASPASGPVPAPLFQWTEIAGMIMGVLLIVVGITYLILQIW